MAFTSLSLTPSPQDKEKTQASAIQQLRESFPQYADAISGDNPPEPSHSYDPSFPSSKIIVYRWIIPTIFGLYILFHILSVALTFTIFISGPVASEVMIVRAVAFSIIALIFGLWSFHHAEEVEQEYRAKQPPPPPPQQMELIQHPFTTKIKDVDFHILLEYEITAAFKGDVRQSGISTMRNMIALQTNKPELLQEATAHNVFHHLITTKFATFLTEYIKQNWEKYDYYCKKTEKPFDPEVFGALIDNDEIEYYLAAPFGQAAYETRIPVFRYRVRVKYELPPPAPPSPPPPPPTRNVVIGELIDIREIYHDGKIPDPWG